MSFRYRNLHITLSIQALRSWDKGHNKAFPQKPWASYSRRLNPSSCAKSVKCPPESRMNTSIIVSEPCAPSVHWLWWPPNYCWINSLHWLTLSSPIWPLSNTKHSFWGKVKIFNSKPLINHCNFMCIQGHVLSRYERFKALVNLQHMARGTPRLPPRLLVSVIHSRTIRK